MRRICLIEDDLAVAEFLRKGLKENDYVVDIFTDGSSGKESLLIDNYDMVVLDVMLPGLNGIDVCREIRKQNLKIPILMLTALGTIDNKITGFKAGADDYLVKPFHFNELLARIEALNRRHNKTNE